MSVSGIIAIWSGSIATIPSGWVICDGNNGTPDLRNNFVVGAGDTYAVDANGGAVSHSHPFSGDGHNHLISTGTKNRVFSDSQRPPVCPWERDLRPGRLILPPILKR